MRLDFDAIQASSSSGAPATQDDIRLTREELIDFFAQAWNVTTTILPMVATASRLKSRPRRARLELHIQNERPENSGKPRALRTFDLVDLSDYGKPRKTHYTDLSVGVTSPLACLRADHDAVHDSTSQDDRGFRVQRLRAHVGPRAEVSLPDNSSASPTSVLSKHRRNQRFSMFLDGEPTMSITPATVWLLPSHWGTRRGTVIEILD